MATRNIFNSFRWSVAILLNKYTSESRSVVAPKLFGKSAGQEHTQFNKHTSDDNQSTSTSVEQPAST